MLWAAFVVFVTANLRFCWFFDRCFSRLVLTGLIPSGSPRSQTYAGANWGEMVRMRGECEAFFSGQQYSSLLPLQGYLAVTYFTLLCCLALQKVPWWNELSCPHGTSGWVWRKWIRDLPNSSWNVREPDENKNRTVKSEGKKVYLV